MTRLFSLLMITALVLAAPAYAAEEKKVEGKPKAAVEVPKKEAEKKDAKAEKPKAQTTPLTKWRDAENKMIAPLNDLDKESIFIMRQKYSIIKTVGIAEKDISGGVKSCGKANPELKEKLETRLDQWKKAINPIIDTANKNLNAEIEKQTIVKTADFKNVLKLQDEAYKYSEKNTTKNYATSKETCEGLLESMNDSEDTMVSLLQDTLLPPSVIKSRIEKVKKEEAKRKSFSKEKTAQ